MTTLVTILAIAALIIGVAFVARRKTRGETSSGPGGSRGRPGANKH